MHASDPSIQDLLRFLPALPELGVLRESLLAASRPDPQRAWERTSAYATVDKRVVPAARLGEVAREAGAAARRRIDRLYSALADVLSAAAAGRDVEAVLGLVRAGEAAEAEGDAAAAVACYGLAAELSEPLPDRTPLALALRRTARARAGLGEFEAAYGLYARSLEQATAVGDVEGRVVAATGLGNMRNLQGRWAEAQSHYEEALALCREEDDRLRGQLCINLSMATRERGLLEDAESWLDSAAGLWDALSRQDRCGWFNNQGLLWMDRGEATKAEAALRQALEHAETPYDRAMALDNLAELALDADRLADAESLAREAEEAALTAASPYALAEVYTCLGRISRRAGRLDGVTFFEKALELCREYGYPLLEARAAFEYGLFRQAQGDTEEARAYLALARDLFGGLGASAEEERAARARAELPATPKPSA